MMDDIVNSGKFLFVDRDDFEICLFFYVKVMDDVMNVILPDGKSEIGEYFVAILKTGMDYLGRTEVLGIRQIMEHEDLIPLDEEYDVIKNHIKITEEELEKYKKFCDEKMKAIYDVHEKLRND